MARRSTRLGGYLSAAALILFLWNRYSARFLDFGDINTPERPISQQATQTKTRHSFKKADPPHIKVTGSRLQLGKETTTDLAELWKEIRKSISATADALFEDTFSPQVLKSIPPGLLGTPIQTNAEFKQLQGYLDCVASEGYWAYDPKGQLLEPNLGGATVHKHSPLLATCDKKYYGTPGPDSADKEHWDVRESLKFRWQPSTECKRKFNPPKHMLAQTQYSLPTRQNLCKYLKTKYILLVGDAPTQYFMHDLLLDWTSDVPLSCYGDLYCAEHSICGDWTEQTGGGNWSNDVAVYNKLPLAPISPATRKLTEEEPEMQRRASREAHKQTMLRYRRTDGLALHKLPSVNALQPVYVHKATGVREINNYAFPDVRRSDIVIVSKAPIPLPLDGGYLKHATQHIQDATNPQEKVKAVLRAAQEITQKVWLPEAITALYNARIGGSLENLLVWRGGWRMQPDCVFGSSSSSSGDFDWQQWWDAPGDGPPPYTSSPSLNDLLYSGDGPDGSTDLDSLFYNLQTILQNEVIRENILSKLGTLYIDMETPMSVWRSGMIGGAGYSPTKKFNSSHPLPPMARNCLQPCLPSAGMSAEEGMIGGLYRALDWAFGGEEARGA